MARFTLTVDDLQQQALVDALFEAGCDDGLVGRADGIQYIEFDREAPGLDDEGRPTRRPARTRQDVRVEASTCRISDAACTGAQTVTVSSAKRFG